MCREQEPRNESATNKGGYVFKKERYLQVPRPASKHLEKKSKTAEDTWNKQELVPLAACAESKADPGIDNATTKGG